MKGSCYFNFMGCNLCVYVIFSGSSPFLRGDQEESMSYLGQTQVSNFSCKGAYPCKCPSFETIRLACVYVQSWCCMRCIFVVYLCLLNYMSVYKVLTIINLLIMVQRLHETILGRMFKHINIRYMCRHIFTLTY